jgi:tetratricopeptide (TPR) repeat protein
LRSALIIIAVLLFLGLMFYAGRKFEYLRYLVSSRREAAEMEKVPDKFPGTTAAELIETGLAAQKRGDWREAAERFVAAKRKDRSIPAILFLVGKGNFDRGDLEGADAALTHAIRFGEDLAESNYYRGLIAVRRHDLSAATRFFEAATNANPFRADYFYFLGETLRLDHHPLEAVRRYEQAVERTPGETDAQLCTFKVRLARLEAGEASKVREELEGQRARGPLSVDWIMTDAALHVHGGEINAAAQLINEARSVGATGLFLTCAGDTLFRSAAETHADIRTALGTVLAPPQ